MSVIFLDYCRGHIKGRNLIMSLVRCDNCFRDRLVEKHNILKNHGVNHCRDCSRIILFKYRNPSTINPKFGKHNPMFGRVGIEHPGHRLNRTKESLEKMAKNRSGSKNWRWDETISDQDRLKNNYGRDKNKLRFWRVDVFIKDGYTCQISNIKGCRLVAHHIFNYKDYPEKRFDVNNGMAIARELHELFHMIYGKRHNNLEQFLEFKQYIQEILA